jgi:hypothetical protein
VKELLGHASLAATQVYTHNTVEKLKGPPPGPSARRGEATTPSKQNHQQTMNVNVQSLHFDADIKLVGFIKEKAGKLSLVPRPIISCEVSPCGWATTSERPENKWWRCAWPSPGNDLFAKRQASQLRGGRSAGRGAPCAIRVERAQDQGPRGARLIPASPFRWAVRTALLPGLLSMGPPTRAAVGRGPNGHRETGPAKNLARIWRHAVFLNTFAGPIRGGIPPKREGTRSFLVVQANVAQLVEQLICNQPVGGSSPFIGSVSGKGEIPKWPTGADCKSAASQLRRFESCSPHHFVTEPCRFRHRPKVEGDRPSRSSGSSSVGRASAFQAECRGFESRLPL